jgi:hypothetical protein
LFAINVGQRFVVSWAIACCAGLRLRERVARRAGYPTVEQRVALVDD